MSAYLRIITDDDNSRLGAETRAANVMQDWKQFDYDDAVARVTLGHCPQQYHSFSDEHLHVQSENQVHLCLTCSKFLVKFCCINSSSLSLLHFFINTYILEVYSLFQKQLTYYRSFLKSSIKKCLWSFENIF